MVKFVNIDKKTKAIIRGCKYDATRVIDRRFRSYVGNGISFIMTPLLEKALMSDSYSGTVKCDDRDEYDATVGKQNASEKVYSNYRNGMKKAIKRWQKAIISAVKSVDEESFKEVLEEMKNA